MSIINDGSDKFSVPKQKQDLGFNPQLQKTQEKFAWMGAIHHIQAKINDRIMKSSGTKNILIGWFTCDICKVGKITYTFFKSTQHAIIKCSSKGCVDVDDTDELDQRELNFIKENKG